jgi:cytochrome c peroxidase
MRPLLFTLVIVVLSAGCDPSSVTPHDPFPLIPAHLPPVPYPADNPITREKAELGRYLFFDGRLARDGITSCASCHAQEKAFSDAPHQVSAGFQGQQGQRNAPMIVNAAYRTSFFWDGRAATLEDQAMEAFMNPIEMAADTIAVAQLMRTVYAERWKRSFGDTAVTMRRVMQAITTFERTLVSANSPYDRFLRGDTAALTPQQRHGMQLFFSDRTMCSSCHGGHDLTNDQFMNVGLFHHYFDRGRYEVTRDPRDEGRFKTPTLRNVELSPPYMAGGDSEAGLMETLEDVVKHYNEGGTTFHSKDKRVKKLNLSDAEQAALVDFMKALTDSSVITDPRFSAPQY